MLKIYEEDYLLNLEIMQGNQYYNTTRNLSDLRISSIKHPTQINKVNWQQPNTYSLTKQYGGQNEINNENFLDKSYEVIINLKDIENKYQNLYKMDFFEQFRLYIQRSVVIMLFIIYFLTSFFIYAIILLQIKSNWRIGFVNSILNLFFRNFLHPKVAYYATMFSLPKKQSQFNRWETVLLTFCYLIEYTFFAYITYWRRLRFRYPGHLDRIWFYSTPCVNGKFVFE